MITQLHYVQADAAILEASSLVVVGRRDALLAESIFALLPQVVVDAMPRMLDGLKAGDMGAATTTWLADGLPSQVVLCLLPEPCSRHNSPARPHAIAQQLRDNLPKQGRVAVLLALDEPEHYFAAGCAVARAIPRFSAKSKEDKGEEGAEREVAVAFVTDGADSLLLSRVAVAADAIRSAGALVDMPTSVLNTDAFVAEARTLADELGAGIDVIRGEDLANSGYGGLWGVGKAAVYPPALVVLRHEPDGASRTLAWVGKGIVYDTGGLSIKGKSNMPGMKRDMGGAAAVIGAFGAAVRAGFPDRLYALLCLAENSVGPEATRPDDILDMYSGKSVEVNNTDAEGRLVLADGVAHAVRHLEPDVLVDLATLTGAQMVATGQRHAAIVCNDEALEAAAVTAGRVSGDLVHPLPYCPEFFRSEFKSEVADLKNSVADRANAQSSCAAQFVGEHLGNYEGQWLHVDLAGPSVSKDRGTGFGVAFLLELFDVGTSPAPTS